MNYCRSCGAPIRWAITERGKRIPLDAEPRVYESKANLFVIDEDDVARIAGPDDDPVYRTHFAVCPDANKWRQSRWIE